MSATPRRPVTSAAHTFTLLSLLAVSALIHAEPMDEPRIQKRALTSAGCYSSVTPLTSVDQYQYQTSGWCSSHCTGGVIALTGGDQCFCGNTLPAANTKVDDALCNTICFGFGTEMCGGLGFYTVYTTGTEANVPSYSGSGSSSSSSSSTSSSSNSNKGNSASPTSTVAATIVTSEVAGGSTVVVTVQPTADPDAAAAASTHHSGGGSSPAGIAAGVVVGLVVLTGIVAGLFFYLRRRKQKQVEDDYKQRTQVADFMRGASERKPDTGYSGMSDSRLDPEAGQRNSVGSLADNEDYSRRILRVANPDSS